MKAIMKPTPIHVLEIVDLEELEHRQVTTAWQQMLGLAQVFAMTGVRPGRTKDGVAVPLCFLDTGVEDRHRDMQVAPWAKEHYAQSAWALRRLVTGGRDCTYHDKDEQWRRAWCYGNEYNRKNWQCCKAEGGDHGLMTSGMAGAVNNEIGIRGIEADVWMLKVFAEPDGILWCEDKWLARGVDAAVEVGDALYAPLGVYGGVLSCSVGGHGRMAESSKAAFTRARKKGWVILASAGNDGGEVMYPAALDDVIAVGALDENGMPVDWSCRGPGLDLAAPGVNVLTLARNGLWAIVDGTSLSCPGVALVAAMLKARFPGIEMNTLTALEELRKHTRTVAAGPGWQLVKADELALLHKTPGGVKNFAWDLGLKVA